MRYIDTNLVSGENVVARAHLHWTLFLGPCLVAALFFPIVVLLRMPLLLFFPVLALVHAWIEYRTSEFAVTNKRVLLKIGCIRRKSEELLLTKVEGIQVTQDIPGRLLGYGSVRVTGTGGSHDPYHRISRPLEFRRHVQEQVALVQGS